jgi:Pyridine nucleotide-disulphide oxidoreductase
MGRLVVNHQEFTCVCDIVRCLILLPKPPLRCVTATGVAFGCRISQSGGQCVPSCSRILPAQILSDEYFTSFLDLMMAPSNSIVDVLIVGGSHAGLAAALTLYRALHTCIIFDTHKTRNWRNNPIRLTPQWEGELPENARKASRHELSKSGLARFLDTDVESVDKTTGGNFRAIDASGREWLGRRLLLAIGMVDVFPAVKGYEECYTKGV